MMKYLLAITIFGLTASSNAETLSVPSLRMEVKNDWVHSIEKAPQAHRGMGDLISIHHPNGNGVLKVQFHRTPDLVSKDILRNMTNLELSTPLIWQNWGANSGYQYDYLESSSFFRQWWLANEAGVIFVVYKSSTESENVEIAEINEIVISITVIKL